MYSTSQPVLAFPDFSTEDMEEAHRFLYGTFLYGRGVDDLVTTLRNRKFRRFFGNLPTSVQEIGIGAYFINRFAVKRRFARAHKNPKPLGN